MKRYERMKKREEQKKLEMEEHSELDVQATQHDCAESIQIRSRVVGIRHRKSKVTAIFAERSWSRFPIKIQRRIDNEQDPNAIAVLVDRSAEDFRGDLDLDEDLLGYLPASFSILLSPLLDTKQLYVHSATLLDFDSNVKSLASSLDISLEMCGALSDEVRMSLEQSALGDLSRQHFSDVIRRAQDRFASTSLITEDELQSAALYLSLPYEGQSLYIKLLQRKAFWFIYTEEIARSALDPLLECSEMIKDKTITLDERREILTSLLSSLTAAELRGLHKRCVNNANAKGDKSEILQKLMRYLFCQRCIDGSPYFTSPLFLKAFCECCSKRCRLSSKHLQVLTRMYRLETLNFDSDMLSMERLSNLKLVKFVSTSLPSDTPFSCRQQFLELESALELLSTCETSLNGKQYASAVQFLPILRSKLCAIKEIDMPPFWLQFHPATVYCSALYLSVKALQKMQQYEDAVNEFMFLLNDVPSHLLTGRRRGKCWARLLLILDVHLKQPELASSLCHIALSDCSVDSGAQIALQDRALRLLKRENQLVFPCYLASISLPTVVPIEIIVGRPLNNQTAERSRFFGYDDDVVSVEELALQYFAKDGWEGFHDEGCLLRTLFGLLLWDIIWRQDIPSVFMASYQDAPLDLGSSQFYILRKQDIESRLQDIEENMDFADELTKVWNNHVGELCRGVSWNQWTLEQLILLCTCINRPSLAAVFRLLAMNYSAWTGGLPDLAIYHPERMQFRLVEVKGPNDRLSEQQRAWLTRLHRFGFESLVLKVKPPDKKAKKNVSK